jgi:hypothetical protein
MVHQQFESAMSRAVTRRGNSRRNDDTKSSSSNSAGLPTKEYFLS